MKKVSPSIIVPVVAMAVVGAGIYGVSRAAADSKDGKSSIVQEIADAFHLDKSKVQAVFNKHKAEMHADRESHYEERLTRAVTDGKLTDSQKTLILAEHKKLVAELEALRDSQPSDPKAEFEKIRQEGLDWAKVNNIDAKWLMLGGGGPRHGFGMRGMMHN